MPTATQTQTRERTKPYQRRYRVSAPYQVREKSTTTVRQNPPALYQRRQQLTVPYQEKNPSKIRANSGMITYFDLYQNFFCYTQ